MLYVALLQKVKKKKKKKPTHTGKNFLGGKGVNFRSSFLQFVSSLFFFEFFPSSMVKEHEHGQPRKAPKNMSRTFDIRFNHRNFKFQQVEPQLFGTQEKSLSGGLFSLFYYPPPPHPLPPL
jgi:hypothetical protein